MGERIEGRGCMKAGRGEDVCQEQASRGRTTANPKRSGIKNFQDAGFGILEDPGFYIFNLLRGPIDLILG